MNLRSLSFLFAAIPALICSCGDRSQTKLKHVETTTGKVQAPNDRETMWPPLPTSGFLKGRPAKQDDVTQGNAAFMLPGSQAMNIVIPQYGYHNDPDSGKRVPGIVIQAERAPDGKELAGMKRLDDGSFVVGLIKEFTLLGTSQPAKQ
jgi:hypothetical protein